MKNYRELYFEVIKGIQEEVHFHPELEILFVLEGEVQFEMLDVKQNMKKEDVVLVNTSVPHRVLCRGEAVLARAYFSYQVLSKFIGNENAVFYCNSVMDQDQTYHEVRSVFHELIYQHVRGEHKTACMLESLLYRLLDCVIENYQIQGFKENHQSQQDERMQQIIHYVNQNYQSGISLTELADSLYVSTSTLSRLFKKQTGIYFADYVNQIRMRYALNDLLYTDKNITKIAVDCGFSNPSGFNKVFREVYGMSPSEYRSRLQEDAKRAESKENVLKEKLKQELKQELQKTGKLSLSDKNEPKSMTVDMNQGNDYVKPWNKVINIGALSNLTLANLQYHTLILTEQLGFSYVRVWNIFSKKLLITDGRTIGNYNYDNINGVFDFLVSHNIRPYLDFGKRPDTVISAEGKSIYFEEECIPFSSRRAWEAMLEDFIVHLVKRYGRVEVENWIFEFSYNRILGEASEYYADEKYDYFEVFRYGRQLIKKYLPNAKVGGFSGIIHLDYIYMKKFLTFCRSNACMPEYISFLLFPYESKGVKYRRALDEQFGAREIKQIYEVMREAGIARDECEIHITEWNHSLSSRNYVNDSCFRAVYFAKDIASIWNSVDLMCVWMGSDWISSYYDSVGVANGGSGLLTKDTIPKPAYYAVQFLNRMGSQLVEKGDNYIITKTGKEDFYILCFYYSWFSCNYFTKEEDSILPTEMEQIFESKEPMEMEFVLHNLPSNGRYTIKTQTVNRSHGSILDEWKLFGYENDIESGDVKYLREICIPLMAMERQEAYENRLRIRKTLQEHELSLIHIYEEVR